MNLPAHLASPSSVLIIKPSSLGDVVSAVPVLRGLRRTFPDAKISWLVATSCADLLAHDSDLAEVILFDRKLLGSAWRDPRGLLAVARLRRKLRKARFDWVIDLQGLLRSGLLARATGAPLRAGFAQPREKIARRFYTHKIDITAEHTIDRNLELARALGIDARPADLSLQVSPRGAAFRQQLLSAHGLQAGGFVVCSPPTRWPTKLYPVRHWIKVAADLAQRLPVVLTGAPGDREMCIEIVEGINRDSHRFPVINIAGETSVAQLVGVMSAARGVVCSDSAAQFVAPALGVPTLALLGPTRLERTGPYASAPAAKVRAIVADIPCQGCLKRACSHITCMQSIRPSEVVQAATELFGVA